MKSGLNYTDPAMRERLKRKIMAGDRGGRPGEWSARKAQLLAAEYEKAGGGYKGGRTKAQRSLSRWTKQDWQTKSGKPSLETGERYLPAAAIAALSSAEYAATTRAKRSATGQFSRQPRRIARKTREFRNPVSYPKEDITYAALSPTPANADIAAGNPLLYPPEQVRAYETEVQSRLGFPDQTQLGADLELQRHRQWNTEEFRKWFGDSVVTKPNGAPLLVYHGTCKAGFTKFDPTKTREMGFHFGTWAQAKDFVGSCGKSEIPGVGPGVYPVYLSIQRALETPDLFSNIPTPFIRWIENTDPRYKWFTGSNDPYFKKLKYLENRGAMALYKFTGSELSKFLKTNNKKLWNHLKAIVMRKGYDGIRYINLSEGNPGFADNIAWIAFSPAQVKSATDNRGTFNRRDAALDNPIPSMVRSKLSRIIEPGDRILCYDRAQGEDLYRLWDMVHTAGPLTKEALVEIEGMLDDDGVLVIESGEEPPGLRDHFRKVIRYGGMLLVQGPMNPEEARINTEKLRREMA